MANQSEDRNVMSGEVEDFTIQQTQNDLDPDTDFYMPDRAAFDAGVAEWKKVS